jgi:hypothetical protein
MNLFSISKLLKNGFKIGNDGIIVNLTKVSTTLSLNRILNTKNGCVSGAKLNPISIKSAGSVIDPEKSEMKVDINRIHKIVGHCGEEALVATANHCDWKLTGKIEVCEECVIAKARQKSTNKISIGGSKNLGERMYIDTSSSKGESLQDPSSGH